MYQPSVSIFIFCCWHASGEESNVTDVLICRALNPNICLRSPVSVDTEVTVTIPPFRDSGGPEAAGTSIGERPELSAPGTIGSIKYLRADSLMVILRFRSHSLMVMLFIPGIISDSDRSRGPLIATSEVIVRPPISCFFLIRMSANETVEKSRTKRAAVEDFRRFCFMICTSLAENDPIKPVGFIMLSSPRPRTNGPNSEAGDTMQRVRTPRQPKIAHDSSFGRNTEEFTPTHTGHQHADTTTQPAACLFFLCPVLT